MPAGSYARGLRLGGGLGVRQRQNPILHALAAQLAAQQHVAPAPEPGASALPVIPGPAGQPGAVRWGGQYFRSPEELVAWMQARGVHTTVARFLARHAGAAAIFGQRQAEASGGGVGGAGLY